MTDCGGAQQAVGRACAPERAARSVRPTAHGGDGPARPGKRARRVAWLAAALVLTSGGAGVAAISHGAFHDAPALTAAELGDIRGGFAVPGLPGVTFAFAVRVETQVSVPGTPELLLETVLSFDDPAAASLATTRTVGGVPDVPTEETVDLTRETVTRALGDPETALVVHEFGRKRFATVMRNLAHDAHVRSHTAVDVTVDGLAGFQSRLPSAGVTSTMNAVRHALTQSLR